jgi:hypothetical protein
MQSNSTAEEDFDAQALHDTFLNAIQELNLMQEKQRKKCQTLEEVYNIYILKTNKNTYFQGRF